MTDSIVTVGPINVGDVATFIVDIQNVNASPETLSTSMLSDRIMSCEWGATRGPFDFISKAKVNQKTDSVNGDSVGWTITNSAQEIMRWPMWANEWRDGGVLGGVVTGAYLNSSGAAYQIYIDLQVCDMPHTTDDISSANFGLLESWTTAYSYLSSSISASGGSTSKPWTVGFELFLEGHTGTTWSQLVHSEFLRGAQVSSSPANDPSIHQISNTTLDPTKDQLFRIVVYTDVALTPGSREVSIASGYSWLMNGRYGNNA